MTRRIACAALAFLTFAPPALAHGFGPDPSLETALAEGVAVMLGWPAIAVSLVAGGLLAGLAPGRLAGLIVAVLIGQVLGIGLTVSPLRWQFFAPFGAGIVAAAVALGGLYRHAWLSRIGLAAVGFGAQAAALDGHQLGDLPGLIHLGYLAVATASVAAVALVLRGLLRWQAAQTPLLILGRILASWCLAMLVLMLAMVLRST